MASKFESANLDALRAIAVLCVALDHALGIGTVNESPLLYNLGRAGVLLFFVHTSLVLMLSLERHTAKFGRRRVWAWFMTRRIFRIYPLSIAVVLLTVFLKLPNAHVHFHSLTFEPVGFRTLLSNLALAQNLTYSVSVPPQLWSLPLEIQMYCVLPFCFYLAVYAKRLWMMIGLWFTVVGLALLYPLVPYTGRFNVLDFAPCFIPGVIAYFMLKNKMRHGLPSPLWPFFIIGALALFSFSSQKFFWPQWTLCLAIGLAIPQFKEIPNQWVNSVTHWVAKYSYGIYLGHLFCLWLVFVVGQNLPVWLQWTVIGPIMAAVSFALFHAIEDPMMKLGAKIAARHIRKVATSDPEPIRVGAP